MFVRSYIVVSGPNVDEIVIDANMDLQWPDRFSIDATKSYLQCLGPLIKWVCALKHLVPS